MDTENISQNSEINTREKRPNNRQSYKRATAVKIDIESLKKGIFVNKDGFEPSYIDTEYGEISRVNIIGVIIAKSVSDGYMEIDDSTAKIQLRTGSIDYSNITNFDNYQLGQVVNVIGKVRIFGSDIYLIPEILRPIKNLKWVELRKLEIKSLKKVKSLSDIKDTQKKETITKQDIEDKKEENNQTEIVLDKLKSLDMGDGVDIESLSDELKINNSKSIINKLLEQGEIFEIRPGRVKVLE
ncbi:MAG: hypothetical protein ACLFUO_05670 [Candidatus Woesearchaeota archaeon]